MADNRIPVPSSYWQGFSDCIDEIEAYADKLVSEGFSEESAAVMAVGGAADYVWGMFIDRHKSEEW